MEEVSVQASSGNVAVDKCGRCSGLWFDAGEAEQLKNEWIAVTLDDGNTNLGKIYNEITRIDCPRCQLPMRSVSDPQQPHLQYEMCPDHGIFMDAGEFSDWRDITLREAFDQVLALYRKSGNQAPGSA